MNARAGFLSRRPDALSGTNLRALAGPVRICMFPGMIILPLPPFLLDLLFTFNIALSVMVLLVSMYTQKPLASAAFPSVLLFSTLLRLSLNVASTRVVLLEGHTGPDAAGQVIESFGHFLVGGNFAVGIVVFVILMVINFMGGLIVGVVQHNMDFAAAGKVYTLLTIGDGLVAQIPSLVISTAA